MKKTHTGKSTVVAVGILASAVLLTLVIAAVIQIYIFPQKANVNGVTFTLNGTAWTNSTAFDWGNLDPGVWTNATLNVKNVGSSNYTVALIPPAFNASMVSAGWSETWNLTSSTVHTAETLNGTLSIYVPASWPPGDVTLPPLEISVNQV